MSMNGQRLKQLLREAGLTQEHGLDMFNASRPKLFDPIALPTWLSYMTEPGSADWKPLSDTLLERAEKVFTTIEKAP